MKWIILLALVSCNFEFRETEIINYPAHQIGDKVCIIGDTGTGKEDQFRVAELLKKENCSQIRITGDVVYPDGLKDENDPLFFERFYNPYKDIIEDGTTFHLTMGNHDHRTNTDAWLYLADKYEGVVFPNYFYAERFGDVCYLNIDTNITYIPEQNKWIDSTLKELNNTCKFIFSIAHHPYISSGKHGNANPFNKIFFRKYILGKVTAHFAGHDHHLSYEGVNRGTHHFVTGAGGKLRDVEILEHPLFSASRFGYVALTYKGDKFIYEFVSLNENNEREVLFTGTLNN